MDTFCYSSGLVQDFDFIQRINCLVLAIDLSGLFAYGYFLADLGGNKNTEIHLYFLPSIVLKTVGFLPVPAVPVLAVLCRMVFS